MPSGSCLMLDPTGTNGYGVMIDFLPGIIGWNLFEQLPENHDIPLMQYRWT
jgi:hypothetical protein